MPTVRYDPMGVETWARELKLAAHDITTAARRKVQDSAAASDSPTGAH